MSLLSICWDVCDENGFPRPTAIASSTDAASRQLFALANKALEELSKYKEWPHLDTEHSFSTVADTERYTLPDDFRTLISPSMYSKSEYYSVRASVPPIEWQERKFGLLGNLDRYSMRLFYSDNQFGIAPAPAGVEDMVFEYVSKNFAKSQDGASTFPKYMQDDNVSVLPEDLVRMSLNWRFRRAKGLEHSSEMAEYNAGVNSEYSKYKALPEVVVGRNYYTSGITDGYVRDRDFG